MKNKVMAVAAISGLVLGYNYIMSNNKLKRNVKDMAKNATKKMYDKLDETM